jgi:hypothetical protein
MFIEAGTAVDMVRTVGFLKTEEKGLRNALKEARMIARMPTSNVNALVVVEYVEECCSLGVCVSDIRKFQSGRDKVRRPLYTL